MDEIIDNHWKEDLKVYNRSHVNCPICVRRDGSCPINNHLEHGGIYVFNFPRSNTEWNLYLHGCPKKKTKNVICNENCDFEKIYLDTKKTHPDLFINTWKYVHTFVISKLVREKQAEIKKNPFKLSPPPKAKNFDWTNYDVVINCPICRNIKECPINFYYLNNYWPDYKPYLTWDSGYHHNIFLEGCPYCHNDECAFNIILKETKLFHKELFYVLSDYGQRTY